MTTRREVESRLRAWLRAHHGVIGSSEAAALGASEPLIRKKVAIGEWAIVYRGVYRDTSVRTTHYQQLEAVIVASHGHAVASHRSAAWIWQLIPQPPGEPELSVRRGDRDVRLTGVTIHTSVDLDPTSARERRGILVTNPLRTLVDLAGAVSPARLTEAVDVAVATRLVTPTGIAAELERLARPGRPGVDAMRRHLLDRGFVGAPAPSVLEAKMHRIIGRLHIPPPSIEVHAGPDGRYRLDIAWPAILFAIEVDGYAWHSSPEAKQHDEEHRFALQQQGWRIKVFDWRRVCHDPAKVAREIAAIYAKLSEGR